MAPRTLRSLRPVRRALEKAMGAILVLTGLLFVTGQMSVIATWLLETFPVFATLG